MIESKLLVDLFIEQLAVIADQRKFVSALIVPNFAALEEYAKDNDIEFSSPEDLCHNKRIIKMMEERIDTLQQQLANYEKVKKFVLLPKPFTMESGELTNTLKIKRRVLNKNYAAEIESMYEESV
jgi:long-chain acyl-CoA synthetase